MTAEHVIILVSVIGGIIGGMGMGGGTLLIPLLTMCSVEQHMAQAINLMAFVPMSVMAILIHKKNGYVCFKHAVPIASAALVSAVLGSFAAGFAKGYVLRACFGAFLTVLGIIQMIAAIRGAVLKYKEKKGKTSKVNKKERKRKKEIAN